MTNCEWLRICRLVPLVAADAAVEDARARAHGSLAVAKRIPHDAYTRGDVVVTIGNHAPRYTLVAREEHPKRSSRHLG